MKAALLTQINAPLEIAELGLTSLNFGQVLVRVLASGICGAQLQEIRGEKGTHFPRLMGHEGCGIVEEIGAGVTKVKPGQKVVMHWRIGAGIQSPPPEYFHNGSRISGGYVTTFNEKAICSENRLTPVPDATPIELCSLLGCGLSTALATIENEAALKMGESVLIVGCGGLGVSLIRAAKMRKASPVVSMDVTQEKRELAYAVGANLYIDALREHFEDTLLRMTKGGFDVIIDTAGGAAAMQATMPLLAPSGRYIMVGQARPGEDIMLTNARHMFDGAGKTIKATQGGGFMPHLDIPRYVKLYQAGELDLSHLITDTLPLSEINKGIELVRKGGAGRVLIIP